MPTEAFINAASATNRQPVVLLAIESPAAIKTEVSGRTEFNAGTLTNINTTYESDQVRLGTDDVEEISGPFYGPVYTVSYPCTSYAYTGVYSPDGYPMFESVSPVISIGSTDRVVGVKLTVLIESYLFSNGRRVEGRRDGGVWETLDSGRYTYTDGNRPHKINQYVDITGLPRGFWEFRYVLTFVSTRIDANLWYLMPLLTVTSVTMQHETHYLPTGRIITADTSLDLGVVPATPSRFEVDDVVNTGCSITYSAWGRNTTAAAWTSLGTITEITPLAPYQYYKIRADLASSPDGMLTPIVKSIGIIGGDSQYTYLSTHKDIPIQGALPYIVPGGVSSISSKIDLTQQATVGELSAKLHWRKKVGDMVVGDFLKNKTIICKLGFIGLNEADYEPYFVGTWYDYQSDQEKGIITVKTRNILKRFNKKVPVAEEFMLKDPATGVWSAVENKTVTYSGNVMRVMLNIIDSLGIPSRLINADSFTDLETGSRSGSTAPIGLTPGSDWYVTRTVTEPQDAMEMLNELSVSSGVFLFEGADGRLTAKLYDDFALAEPVTTLDAMHCKFKPVDAGQKDLYTRSAIYYSLIPGNTGGSATDYKELYLKINQESEIAWEESNTREWFDNWGISVNAIQKLAARWESWFSVPRATVRVDDLPPRFYSIERGAVVAVDNLQLPCPADDWQGYTSGTKFLVMGKSISDPTTGNLTISLDLLQLEAPNFTTDPNFPNYSRLDYWPAVTELTAVERFDGSNGVVNSYLDISFTDPDGYTTGSAIIWVRTNSGEWVSHTVIPLGSEDTTKRLTIPVTPGDSVEVKVSTTRPDDSRMPLDIAPTTTTVVSTPTTDPTKLLQILNPDISNTQITNYLSDKIPLLDILDTGSAAFTPAAALSSAAATILQGLQRSAAGVIAQGGQIQAVAAAVAVHDGDLTALNVTVSGLISNDYNPSLAYSPNSYVRYTDGIVYRCIAVTSPGVLPTNAAYWEPSSSMLTLLSDVQQGIDTLNGEIINKVNTVTYNIDKGDLEDATSIVDQKADRIDSKIVATTTAFLGGEIFDPTRRYLINDVVMSDNLQYRCIVSLPDPPLGYAPVTDNTHWLSVPLSGRMVVAESHITQNTGSINITAETIVGPLAFSAAAATNSAAIFTIEDIPAVNTRLSKVSISADSAAADILLAASRVDTLTGRVSAAEIDIDGAAAEITLRATKDELAAEVVVMSDMIGLKLAATGTVGPGMAIGWTDGTHTKSIIRFNTDTFQVGHTDSTGYVNVFTVGDIDGVASVGVSGDMVIDGSLSARSFSSSMAFVSNTLTFGDATHNGIIESHNFDASATGVRITGGASPSIAIKGGSFSAGTITGTTITGGTLQTAAAGLYPRVAIVPNSVTPFTAVDDQNRLMVEICTESAGSPVMSIVGNSRICVYAWGGSNKGIVGQSVSDVGIHGISYGSYGGKFEGVKGAIELVPSGISTAPTHVASRGVLWVTSGGILYINTSGSTTWQKVGAQ